MKEDGVISAVQVVVSCKGPKVGSESQLKVRIGHLGEQEQFYQDGTMFVSWSGPVTRRSLAAAFEVMAADLREY